MKHLILGSIVAFIFLFVASSVASAQTSAGGLFKPWPKGKSVELHGDVLMTSEGKTDVGNNDYQLTAVEAYGRVRLINEYELNPTIGFQATYLDFDASNNALPNQLTDQSIGFGTPITQWENGWFLAMDAAIGYAGSRPYAQGDAWYGKATAIVGKKLGEEDTLVFGLDYNGNRSFMPDVPLPGVAYSHRIDKTLLLAIGFPYESVEWTPIEGLKVDAYFDLPDQFRARVSYNFIETFGIFAAYEDRIEPFHVQGLADNDRLFFNSHRVEGGVRADIANVVTIFAAVGYQFGSEFNVGFDTRNYDTVLELSDELYGRITAEARW